MWSTASTTIRRLATMRLPQSWRGSGPSSSSTSICGRDAKVMLDCADSFDSSDLARSRRTPSTSTKRKLAVLVREVLDDRIRLRARADRHQGPLAEALAAADDRAAGALHQLYVRRIDEACDAHGRRVATSE